MEIKVKKAEKLEVTVETPSIGDVYFVSEFENDENFIIKMRRSKFSTPMYSIIDVSSVVEHDIERFKKLNEISDENHQIYLDTLCLYGVKISGNYIRLQYWFHQDGDEDIHRMCSGCLTHSRYTYTTDGKQTIFNECYSSDVCVYW